MPEIPLLDSPWQEGAQPRPDVESPARPPGVTTGREAHGGLSPGERHAERACYVVGTLRVP